MKKILRVIIGCLVLINVFVGTAFAGTPAAAYTSVDQISNLCDKSEKYSNGIEQNMARRGNFFVSRRL